jgi:hypothetical protein
MSSEIDAGVHKSDGLLGLLNCLAFWLYVCIWLLSGSDLGSLQKMIINIHSTTNLDGTGYKFDWNSSRIPLILRILISTQLYE